MKKVKSTRFSGEGKATAPKPRLTKYDKRAQVVTQDFTHMSSGDIARQREILIFSASKLDLLITELNARLADTRDQRSQTEANIDALTQLIGKRQVC